MFWRGGITTSKKAIYEFYLHIIDKNFPETIWKHMLCFLGTAITNIWHQILALEPPSNSVVNTFGFSPVPLEFSISVTLVADELFSSFLDDLGFIQRSD